MEAVGSSLLDHLPPPTQGREITVEGGMRLNICKKLLLVLGKEWCEIKGYKEELLVQADDVAIVVAERKANLVPHCRGDAGRSDCRSLGNASLLSVLMPGHVATHAPSLATQAQQESASANVSCAEVENL